MIAPGLTFVFEARVQVGAPVAVGGGRMIPIIGGTFEGAQMRGVVLAGGADWQRIRPDGVVELEARYVIETDSGVRIGVTNRGYRHGPKEVLERLARGEAVAPSEYYFRALPTFDVESGPLDWMTRTLFICTGERHPALVVIRVWAVD